MPALPWSEPTTSAVAPTRHYLDHASTSPLRPEARSAMAAWDELGVTADPGRVHTEGRMVRATLEQAREQVAHLVGVRPRQVIFTSGGTEAINAATWGMLAPTPGAPVLVADVEHSAVREASSRHGSPTTISVDQVGRIHPQAVSDALDQAEVDHGSRPVLAHCQWANHEVGTVQPVEEIAALCRAAGVPLHVDAVTAAGHVPVDVGALTDAGVDLVTVSAHKLGGPPGIGALIVRRNLRIDPLLVGGDQERGRRGGMEDVRAAIGFGAAAQALTVEGCLDTERNRARHQTEVLLEAATAVPGVLPFGDTLERVPHIVCLGVDGVEAEPVLLGLDQAGVAVHSGSSCSSESLEPSPILAAMGVDGERSLRLSVGWSTTDADITAFCDAFAVVVAGLRSLRS